MHCNWPGHVHFMWHIAEAPSVEEPAPPGESLRLCYHQLWPMPLKGGVRSSGGHARSLAAVVTDNRAVAAVTVS